MSELDETGMADLKLTVTLTYKADPKHYHLDPDESEIVESMAAIDQESFTDDLDDLLETLAGHDGEIDIKVEPLPEGEI